MKVSDAAQLLDLSGHITPDLTKTAYHTMAKRYHPDINPAGEEMMKVIIDAFRTLQAFEGDMASGATQRNGQTYPEALNSALSAIIATTLDIEICGAWIWVTGDTYQFKRTLRTNGFRWASGKKKWFFRPDDWKSNGRGRSSMDGIRRKYGSLNPERDRQHLDDLIN